MSAATISPTIIPTLPADRARELVEKIKVRAEDYERTGIELRAYVMEFHDGRGWIPLGYPSFEAVAAAEFGKSWQHAYRLIAAGKVAQASPTLPPDMPLSHAGQLNRLPTPELREAAYREAEVLASTEGDDQPVLQRHVQTAVELELTRQQVYGHPIRNAVVVQMMAQGEVTPKVALDMHKNLDKVRPRVRGYLSELIAKHRMTDPALIEPLGDYFERRDSGDHSKVLDTLLATGTLAGTPLKRATLSDLNRAKAEAQAEHISEKEAEEARKRGWSPVVVSLRRGDAGYTARTLARTFKSDELQQIIQALQEIANSDNSELKEGDSGERSE